MENVKVTQYIQNPATGDMEPFQEPISREAAYDMVRKEFYALRQQEEIERRIAAEEARMIGAYFGKSRLEVGMELEGKTWDRWKEWAVGENEKAKADRASAYANFTSDDDTKTADAAVLESEVEDILEPRAPRDVRQ